MNFICFDTSCVSLENVRAIELDEYTIKFHYSTRSPIYYLKKTPLGGEPEFATIGFKTKEEAKENFEKVKKMLDKITNL